MNMIRSLFPLLFAAALCAQEAKELRIGTWNLEWFGGPPAMRSVRDVGKERELPPRDAQDLQKMGAFVRELGVSALAVQEIGSGELLNTLAKQIGPSWNAVLGTTGGVPDGSQSIGFLYDGKRVELLWAEELLEFPRKKGDLSIFNRVPVTACFRDSQSGVDFRAICVHLKAGGKAEDEKKRALEAQGLRDWLMTLQASKDEDQDIVVLGDFNSTYGTEVQKTLEESGVARYLPQLRPEPTIMHFPEPIDQIAPSPRFLEIAPASFDAHSEPAQSDRESWRKTYSDHFPVTVTLVSNGDDDPSSSFARGKKEHQLPTSARQGAADGTTKPASMDSPFVPGTAVVIRFLDVGTDDVEGLLINKLGTWVEVRDMQGTIRAFPMSSVREVRRR